MMTGTRNAIFLGLFVCVIQSVALARTWTSRDGNYTLEAEFVSYRDGKVQSLKVEPKNREKDIVLPQ